MNPFDLRGPEFLVFYLLFSIIVILVLHMVRSQRESNPGSDMPRLADPYKVAYLRRGKNEAIRVAEFSLFDRGYLKFDETNIVKVDKPEAKFLKDPLEIAILGHYELPHPPSTIFQTGKFESLFEIYQRELEGLGLLPGYEGQDKRNFESGVVLTILASLVLIKVVMAVTGGHPRVLYLFVLFAASMLAVYLMNQKRLTTKGQQYLTGLAQLISRYSSDTNELAWAAAVFGLSVIPISVFPQRQKVFGKAAANGGTSNCSSCCSSCGSSSSSSSSDSGSSSGGDSGGGSSCGGGGGCGGGCGGCGS